MENLESELVQGGQGRPGKQVGVSAIIFVVSLICILGLIAMIVASSR